MNHLLNVLTEGRAEFLLQGLLVTVDRGYGPMALLKILLQHGMVVIMVMPDHLIR